MVVSYNGDSFAQAMAVYKMDQVWDVAFALTMAGHGLGGGVARECIFPEMPRTKHIGDRSRGWLTTSVLAQHSWFDLMVLHDHSQGIYIYI